MRWQQGKFSFVLGGIAAVGAILSVISVPATAFAVGDSAQNEMDQVKAIILTCWTIGVPFFFAIEAYHIMPSDPDCPSSKLYAANRDLWAKLWLAVAASLTLIYFGDHLKNPSRAEISTLNTKVEQLEQLHKSLIEQSRK